MKFQSELELARGIRAKDLSESLRPELPVRQVKIGRFSRLNDSARNSRFSRSEIGVNFANPKSREAYPGPVITPLGAFPNWPSGWSWNAFTSNHSSGVFGPVLGSPVRLGRSLNAPVSLWSPVRSGVSGRPACATRIVFSCQPPTNFWTIPLAFEASAFPFPTGNHRRH